MYQLICKEIPELIVAIVSHMIVDLILFHQYKPEVKMFLDVSFAFKFILLVLPLSYYFTYFYISLVHFPIHSLSYINSFPLCIRYLLFYILWLRKLWIRYISILPPRLRHFLLTSSFISLLHLPRKRNEKKWVICVYILRFFFKMSFSTTLCHTFDCSYYGQYVCLLIWIFIDKDNQNFRWFIFILP